MIARGGSAAASPRGDDGLNPADPDSINPMLTGRERRLVCSNILQTGNNHSQADGLIAPKIADGTFATSVQPGKFLFCFRFAGVDIEMFVWLKTSDQICFVTKLCPNFLSNWPCFPSHSRLQSPLTSFSRFAKSVARMMMTPEQPGPTNRRVSEVRTCCCG